MKRKKKGTKEEKQELTKTVLEYYDQHKRLLPWRDTGNPYYVWLSEIMLQQTRVEAVKEYFSRFIAVLPDIATLAKCEEEVLLKLWEGLGYYSRARNLKKAAEQIVNDYGGRLPETKEELLKLAGIGSYTAGAIASIAFGQRKVALDGNLIRVFSRLDAVAEDFSKQAAKNALEKEIQSFLPEERPGDFNQAIMDIGATICLPNGKPLCDKCPLVPWCAAHEIGSEQSFPLKKEKKARKVEKRTVFILQYKDKVFLRKRNQKGVLRGLWEFPAVEEHLTMEETINRLESEFLQPNLEIVKIEEFLPVKHIFSHLEWEMVSYWVVLQDKPANQVAEQEIKYIVNQIRKDRGKHRTREDIAANEGWAGKEDIKQRLSLPSAFKVYQQSVLNHL